ncbi:polysaccharide deacetylase family protein [Desulfobacter hydrogenophilus]|uniref:Polysaccharide deacetylase family protein n=1 Tax=Desulfobacter hydrogenophilus TaxID=2291 RepID=A0A328F9F3_9BACT|nr:polysaccharide deacetylase family protein [Desulfobacter hydrogenophilus]NDY72576.1 polysaccharide deacetylase family protein [Desulfobacter hydrogenophilus]QBH13299.1 polysaccharide deacetylase family protein [Desulfobacter hydrogenophilus]RAM01304.1 polysaccharide deacetylase family protein [Desulfobacter hydrogenophilus]
MKIPAKRSLTTGEKTGIAAFILAGSFFVLWGPIWSTLPLAGFVLLCLVAPFATDYGFFLPVVCRGGRNVRSVSLSFDDGPDSMTTPFVLEILKSYQMPATFFVTGKNARSHPDLIARILEQGHTIGNHTYSHDSLIMLKSYQRLKDEINKTQRVLAAHGIRPLVFRPPAGITNPKLRPVLAELGLNAVNFSCRAMDKGNRRIAGIASKILNRVRPGDIILLHDSKPWAESPGVPDDTAISSFLIELGRVLDGLETQKLSVVPLSELIGQPIMEQVEPIDAFAEWI